MGCTYSLFIAEERPKDFGAAIRPIQETLVVGRNADAEMANMRDVKIFNGLILSYEMSYEMNENQSLKALPCY